MDHNLLSILVTILIATTGVVFFMLRSWANHINDSIDKLQEKIDAMESARTLRWIGLFSQCTAHGERIAKLEGSTQSKSEGGQHGSRS